MWERATAPARFSIIHHKTGVRSAPNMEHVCIIVITCFVGTTIAEPFRTTKATTRQSSPRLPRSIAGILPDTARDLVVEACLHLDGTKCALHGFVVMPDHVHVVFTPMTDDDGPISLPEVLQKVKSESAHRINRLLGRKGGWIGRRGNGREERSLRLVLRSRLGVLSDLFSPTMRRTFE